MSYFSITREIGIDAGHRVTYHGSKCRKPHGHRYTIHATCTGKLAEEGEEMGMVMDFGFLKDEMMREIDDPCDHGFICWSEDSKMLQMYGITPLYMEQNEKQLKQYGYLRIENENVKLYIVPFVPTAENLAKHWYERLYPRVKIRTDDRALLSKVVVWETPNCSAEYPYI